MSKSSHGKPLACTVCDGDMDTASVCGCCGLANCAVFCGCRCPSEFWCEVCQHSHENVHLCAEEIAP